jgi:enoyl-CoA hydratase
MDLKNLLMEKEDGIATVTFNRPEALNALNTETFHELEKAFGELNGDDEVRVIILTGAGKAFVAGADIAEMKDYGPKEATEFSKLGQRIFRFIETMDKPVIAAVNGYALGGGCETAMACDVRIASEKALLGQPELKLGLIPGFAGTQRLPRLVGLGRAKEMIFTGDPVGAEEAFRIGLVNRVVPHEELMDAARELARKFMKVGPRAVKVSKTAVNQAWDTDLPEGSLHEAEAFGGCFGTEEAKEGMNAFLEKRKPNW